MKKIINKISALVVLLFAASTTLISQSFETIVVTQDSLGNNIYTKVSSDTINPSVQKRYEQPRSTQPSYTKFFDKGITGINEVVARVSGQRYVSTRDYNGSVVYSYAELLTQHLQTLNDRYGWGFRSVTADTMLWILNHSEEVYTPFGAGEYTIFYFDRNGVPTPRTRTSNGAEKLIKFHNIAYINCASGGNMMPAMDENSYPVRNNVDHATAHPYSDYPDLSFMYWDEQRDFKMMRHYARMHGMDAVMTPNGPWLFIPEDDSLSFSDILERVLMTTLVLAIIGALIWLFIVLVWPPIRRTPDPLSTTIISITNSTTIIFPDDEDEPIDPLLHQMD